MHEDLRKSYFIEGSRVSLCEGATIRNSTIKGPVNIEKYSTVADCTLQGFNGLGCFSYIKCGDIGRYATIGSRCSIGPFDHPTNWLSVSEFQYRDTSFCYGSSLKQPMSLDKGFWNETIIGHDVWIGDNCVILRGVNISPGAIIGAGSIVTKDVPPFAIYAGNPARLIRFRFEAQLVKELLEVCWWDLSIEQLDVLNLNYRDIPSSLGAIKRFKDRIK